MRIIRFLAKFLLLLVLIGSIGAIWKREELSRLMAVNSLFDESRIVNNFSAMNTMFLTTPLSRGYGVERPLPRRPNMALQPETERWIAERSVTSLVVMKDGIIVYEDYFQGTEEDDLRISWSVAKSFLSALFGILLEEGAIASLDDPVAKYAPELAGSAYEWATIRDVLHMASGVEFNEDYLDFYSDINRMGRVLALGGSMDKFAAGLEETRAAPGEEWHYVSIDTHVIGMVLRGATGRSIPDLMEEKLLLKMGLERPPYYITDGRGVAFVLGGMNMTTRDYARFGQMYLQDGYWNDQQIVPADWVRASTLPTAPTAPDAIGYGYQWWVPQGAPEGEFMARGIYGQYIYVNRPKGVVIATNAADRRFRDPGVNAANIAMFRAIADAL